MDKSECWGLPNLVQARLREIKGDEIILTATSAYYNTCNKSLFRYLDNADDVITSIWTGQACDIPVFDILKWSYRDKVCYEEEWLALCRQRENSEEKKWSPLSRADPQNLLQNHEPSIPKLRPPGPVQ